METYIYNKALSIVTGMIITKTINTTWYYLKKLRKVRRFVSKKKNKLDNKIHDVQELVFNSPVVKI